MKVYILEMSHFEGNPCYFSSLKELAECLEDMIGEEEDYFEVTVREMSRKKFESLGEWEG